MAQTQYSAAERRMMQQNAQRSAMEMRGAMNTRSAMNTHNAMNTRNAAQARGMGTWGNQRQTNARSGAGNAMPHHAAPPPAHTVPPPRAETHTPPPNAPPPPPKAAPTDSPLSMLSGLLGGIDKDWLLLAGLALLIYREGGEWTLLAALAYVLL